MAGFVVVLGHKCLQSKRYTQMTLLTNYGNAMPYCTVLPIYYNVAVFLVAVLAAVKLAQLIRHSPFVREVPRSISSGAVFLAHVKIELV